MIHQLRIYKINPTLKEAFEERFRKHALRIMESYGFTIVSMWFSENNASTEFIYILKWPDVATMQKQWDAFLGDPEWEAIKSKSREIHGEMVLEKVRDQILDNVDWFTD